ncbi:MAG: hypothetical protein JW880_05250 [Candidatus Thermoplasmatota archaeon]|nr:hypothetical protein [Candidatus Thermoplasmatota archaeon]
MAAGGTVEITAYMVGRWIKAAFLVILGIVLLLYSQGLVDDLRDLVESSDGEVAFEWIWDLLTILLWILVAWLFVLAALNIAFSFQEAKYSLYQVTKRLDRIDRKLGIKPVKVEPEEELEGEVEVQEVVRKQPPVEEDLPPPPNE